MRPAGTTEAWRDLPDIDPSALERLHRIDATTPQEEAGIIAGADIIFHRAKGWILAGGKVTDGHAVRIHANALHDATLAVTAARNAVRRNEPYLGAITAARSLAPR